MVASQGPFDRSIVRQIALNRARTPTQRFEALCDLLDTARAMAPRDPQAVERRRLALAARRRDQEQWRERCRRLLATQRADAPAGV